VVKAGGGLGAIGANGVGRARPENLTSRITEGPRGARSPFYGRVAVGKSGTGVSPRLERAERIFT